MSHKLDLFGQRFGRLTVISSCENISGRTAWLCECDCGNQKKVNTSRLTSGNTRSCGCLQKDTASKLFAKDITNQQFGQLIATKPTLQRKHGSIIWKCQCSCGNIHLVSAEILLAGQCQSCGCIRSKGNATIAQLLNGKYCFQKEYQIRINNVNYYFDFVIYNQDNAIKCLIEYDGILHFDYIPNRGWNNKENWERTQQNDIIKNTWCKEQNIPLIRVPYTDFNKLDFNYLKERIELT